MAAELVAQGGTGLASPVFDAAGALFAVSTQSGEIHQLVVEASGASLQTVASTYGSPTAVAFDPEGTMYVCDQAHGAIMQQGADKTLVPFVNEYEANTLKGPSSVQIDARGNMFFCDSGPLGETTLQSPRGSVFTISADGQLLQPLALECLAHPCGVAVVADSVIVAEMMTNRLLRFVQRPTGVYHCSVFYQFSGGIGPSAIARDDKDNLYVARYDFAAAGKKGIVSQITSGGTHVRDFELPAAELSGVAVDNVQKALVVTEASTNSIYRISLV